MTTHTSAAGVIVGGTQPPAQPRSKTPLILGALAIAAAAAVTLVIVLRNPADGGKPDLVAASANLIHAADAAFKDGNYEATIATASKVPIDDPAYRHAKALVDLATRDRDARGTMEELKRRAEAGELAEARALWLAALADASAIGARPLTGQILGHLGELALAEGKVEEAQRRLAEARAIAHDVVDRPLAATCLRLLAQALRDAGKPRPARELAEEAVRAAVAAALPEQEALAMLALGQILSQSLYDADRTEITGPVGESPAEPYFRRAMDLLRGAGSEAELAKAHALYGQFLVENGRVADGKDMLRDALAALTRLGLRHAADAERVLRSV
jgi:tetratricopeptide (TPR) repeat protein